MKYLVILTIFSAFWSKFSRIAEMNSLKEEAAVYYKNKEYQKSIDLYQKLLTEYKETDETVKLNLANCFFELKRYNSAIDNYRQLTTSREAVLKSNAYLQLGVIYSSNNKKEIGLSYFKEALKALPENEAARFNYEMLKKEQEQTQKDISTDKKRENSQGENQTSATTTEESRKTDNNKGSNGENPSNNADDEHGGDDEQTGGEDEDELQSDSKGDKETDALASQRLEEMQMNDRQAKMILRTMKNNEIQYIQQRHKTLSTKPAPGKPDW